jgi:hypothetical protein
MLNERYMMTREQQEKVQSVIENLPNYYEVDKLEVGDFAKLGWRLSPSSMVKILRLKWVGPEFCYITYMHVGYDRQPAKGYYVTHSTFKQGYSFEKRWMPRGGQDYYTFNAYNAVRGFNCYGDILSENKSELV